MYILRNKVNTIIITLHRTNCYRLTTIQKELVVTSYQEKDKGRGNIGVGNLLKRVTVGLYEIV